jgi:DNA-binding transcriptional MerR regulator
MLISELAGRSGVPVTTLRFYEGAGLLPAGRTASGYRVYGQDAVERLAFIGAAKRLGLPLEEVGELLTVREAGACADVRDGLRRRVAARLAEAGQRAAELQAFTALLCGALEHLDALPDRAGRCDQGCGFPAAQAARPGVAVLAPGRPGGGHDGQDAERAAAPVACSLTGDGMAERAAAWREAVAGAGRVPIPGGLRMTLPADRAAAVAGLAAAEQRCCPFFGFLLRLDGQVLQLEVRAPADGAGLLFELFGPAA